MHVTASLPGGQTDIGENEGNLQYFPHLPAGSTQNRTPGAAYFTVETLAAHFDLEVRTVQKWAVARRLPGAVRAGKLWRFDRIAVEKAALSGSLLLPPPKASGRKIR